MPQSTRWPCPLVRLQSPVHVADLRAVGDLRARAAPEVPIERGGRVLRLGILQPGGIVDLGIDLHDLARLAGVDELLDFGESLALAALEADLHDAAMLGGRLDHGLALANVVGQRLLAIDVKPALQGGDELQGVPVRRSGDNHRVEPLEVEQFLVQLERLRPLALQLLQFVGALFQVIAIHVAQGRDLDAAHFQGRPGIDHAIPADADHAEAEGAIFGRSIDRSAQGDRGGRRCRAAQELSP